MNIVTYTPENSSSGFQDEQIAMLQKLDDYIAAKKQLSRDLLSISFLSQLEKSQRVVALKTLLVDFCDTSKTLSDKILELNPITLTSPLYLMSLPTESVPTRNVSLIFL